MKKILAFLTLMLAFSSCSTDGFDDDWNNQDDDVVVEPKQIISDICYKINSYDTPEKIEGKTFGIKQRILLEALFTIPEDDIESVKWVVNEFGIGKELKGNSVEHKFEYPNDKAEVSVYVVDKDGNNYEATTNIAIVHCDFGFGVWGDDIDIIKRSEDGKYSGIQGSKYVFTNGSTTRYYTFMNKALFCGTEDFKYSVYSYTDANLAFIWQYHEAMLKALEWSYGEGSNKPTGFTDDESKNGLAILNGAIINMNFSNDEETADYYVRRSGLQAVIFGVTYTRKN